MAVNKGFNVQEKVNELSGGMKAVAGIIFAVLMLVGGAGTLGVYVMITIMVAFWAIFMGFSNIFNSLSVRKDEAVGKSWIWMLVCGILSAICGFCLLVAPVIGTYFTFLLFDIYAGISMIFVGFGGLAAILSGKKAADGPEEGAAA